jgi:medium-chain acyl-[acyl-carrier-protein] hydrolase
VLGRSDVERGAVAAAVERDRALGAMLRRMSLDASKSWWVVPESRRDATMRLFCFPYAGGSGTVFHRFAQAMPEHIEVASLQVPGRGFRLRDAAIPTLDGLLDAVEGVIASRLDRPYAFFGHSLGAIVAFELARRGRRAGLPAPAHLFASAAPAPRATRHGRSVSRDLEAPAFWQAVHALYGTPTQVLADPELLAMVVPPLKADFALFDAYRYEEDAPLSTPITAFFGSMDPMVDRAAADAWRAETTDAFALHEVPGPHLYVQVPPIELVKHVRAALG